MATASESRPSRLERRRFPARVLVGSLCSAALHAVAAAFIAYIGAPEENPPRVVEFVVTTEDGPAAPPPGRRGAAAKLEPGGTRSSTNIDAPRDGGSGGSRYGANHVILLMPRADAVTLQDSPMNAWSVAQTQRIRTDRDRATQERRRATPNPHDDPFLASGAGAHPERRPLARVDAQVGANVAPTPDTVGFARSGRRAAHSDAEARRLRAGETTSVPLRADVFGGRATSPGRGIQRGTGPRRSAAARVAHGRPPVDEGPAAVPSERVNRRIRDAHDAELLASRLVQSWTEATQRRGREEGLGVGGRDDGAAPGSGDDVAAGGSALPYGPGPGRFSSLDTSDGRYQTWYGLVRRRVHSRLSFPRERALAMDQGWSVHRIRVDSQGELVGVPELQRSSGFGDFDEAALAAIVTAAPFPPPPAGLLSPRAGDHTLSMRIEHANPMVR